MTKTQLWPEPHNDLMLRRNPILLRLQLQTYVMRRIGTLLESIEDVCVAVQVAFDDLTVIRPGIPGSPGVGEHDPVLELAGIDIEQNAADLISLELDC